MALELTFFGGVGDFEHGELGGVQCLVNDTARQTKFLFECGQRPDHTNDYYGFPYRPKSFQALSLSEHLQLYPQLANLYRHDYEEFRGNKIGPPPVEAILLSHAHYDHNGGLTLIRHDLPVYAHPLSVAIMWLWQYTSGRTINQFVDLYDQFSLVRDASGKPRFPLGEEGLLQRDLRSFNSGEPFTIGEIAITPYLVDHSLAGACGFIWETSAGKIGVSGDIRLRGRRRKDTENFVAALLEQQVDYLMWEGSLLHFEHEGTEDDVAEVVSELIKKRAFAAVAYAPRDFDRIVSLYHAAKNNGRMLVISPAQALYLQYFNGQNGYPKLDHKYVGVYLPRKRKGLIDREGYTEETMEEDYYYWERKFLGFSRWNEHEHKKQRVSIEDLKAHQDKFLVFMPYSYMADMLEEIHPAANSIYFRSHPAPWTAEMEIQEQRQVNLLKQFGMYDGPQEDYLLRNNLFVKPIMQNMHQVHVPGHLNRRETREILRKYNRKIIPYHCKNPQDFVEDVAKHVGKENIIIPRRGEKLVLG